MKSKVKTIGIILSLIFALIYISVDSDYTTKSLFSLREVNSHEIIIDDSFFLDHHNFNKTLTKINQIFGMRVFKSMFGLPINTREPIYIAIQSNGGYLHLLEQIIDYKMLIDSYVICTISTANSAAFTFMVRFCDERIILPDAEIMTHKAFAMDIFGNKIFTDYNKLLTVKHSDLEAEILNIDKDKWYKLSRESGDKFFTKEELKKYNIGTEFIDFPKPKIKKK